MVYKIMSGNLLDNSKSGNKNGLISKLKDFFNGNKTEKYSDNFAKEKEIIANYKSKITEDKKKEIEEKSIEPASQKATVDLYKSNKNAAVTKEAVQVAPKLDSSNFNGSEVPLASKDVSAPKAPFSPELTKNDDNAEEIPSRFSIGGIKKMAREKTQSWQAPKMVTTNLIQSEVLTYMDWTSRIKILSIAIVSSLVVLLFAYTGLIYWDISARAEANILGAEIESLNKQVESAEKRVVEVDAFKGKLALIKNLLDKHIYWTNLFSFLEENILSNSVILGGFSGDTMGQYNFNIIGTSYSNVPEQIMILRENELVDSAEITEAKQGVDKNEISEQRASVSYNLKLNLDPRLFYNTVKSDK